jgi:rhodanese-related sulfurtransferase
MPALDPQAVSARIGGTAILDVRDQASFQAGHLAGAGHLPRAELHARRTELPPRDEPLLVAAASADEARAAAEELARLGYGQVDWLAAPLAALPGGLADRGPAARLWRPAPFLVEVLPRVLAVAPGPALDLAAGAGREAVTLALHGFEVEAVDDDPEILARAESLAARHGVRIRTRVADLECRDPGLAEEAFGLIIVFRFLYRPLLPVIARAIAPGGWLVYETFRRGQRRFGRPTHPRFLLDDGELKSAFPGLAVMHYEEPNPPGGPIMARLLAHKPSHP